jgi:hypothetical protein
MEWSEVLQDRCKIVQFMEAVLTLRVTSPFFTDLASRNSVRVFRRFEICCSHLQGNTLNLT